MHLQPIESPVRPAHRTSGVTRPLAVTLALATAVVGILLIPSESRAQSCYCPYGTDYQGNPVTSTTCGEQVCGADFQWYSCQSSGWSFEGGACGGPPEEDPPPPPTCYCPYGTDYQGNPITSSTCGERVCGADFQDYSCWETGWIPQGTSCPGEGSVAMPPLPNPPPLDTATVTAILGVNPVSQGIDLTALGNQIHLSNARVSLGHAQHALAALPEPAPQWQRDMVEAGVATSQATVEGLMGVEASLPVDQVERARMPVFIARISQLETQFANTPGYAVQLARQTYYNGVMYSAASGAPAISDAMISMAGLPHGPLHPDENGGYIANIRTPNGEQADLGHTMCAVDFNAHPPRVGSDETYYRNLQSYGHTILPNPANHGGMVTLAGDLGTAANYWLSHGNDGWAALMNEGHSDMRGDVDGINLSMILESNGWSGATPVASALTGYYLGSGSASYTSRAQLFMDTSPYVFYSEDLGQYVIEGALTGDVNNVAAVFSLMGHTGITGIEGSHPVIEAFGLWLYREQHGLNPPLDE